MNYPYLLVFIALIYGVQRASSYVHLSNKLTACNLLVNLLRFPIIVWMFIGKGLYGVEIIQSHLFLNAITLLLVIECLVSYYILFNENEKANLTELLIGLSLTSLAGYGVIYYLDYYF